MSMDPIKRPACWGMEGAYEVGDPECDACTFRHSCAANQKETANTQRGHSRTTYIYCEKAPPRDVLEASGLVWSFGLKAEYERHVRHFRSYGGNYLIEGTYYLVPDCEFPCMQSILLPLWQSNGLHMATTAEYAIEKGQSRAAKCRLCGGWIMETNISNLNDKRLRPQVELFSTKRERTIWDMKWRQEPGQILVNLEAVKKLVKREETAREAFNRVYRPEGKKIDTIQVDDSLDWNKLEKHVQEQHGRAQKTGMPVLGVRQAAEGFGDCKSCVRGPYTFTIEQRPEGGIRMRCTSPSPAGNFLVSEKLITESDMLQPDFSVYGAWKQFVDSIALEKDQPRANGCESKFAHICEGKVQGCWFHNGDGTATKTYHFCARAIELHRDRGNKIYVEPDKEEAEKVGRETSKMFEFPLMYGRLANRNGDIFSDETLRQFKDWYVAKQKELKHGATILPTLEFPNMDYAEMEKRILAQLGLRREALKSIISGQKIDKMEFDGPLPEKAQIAKEIGLPGPRGQVTCPIRAPESCGVASRCLSDFICQNRCPLRDKP